MVISKIELDFFTSLKMAFGSFFKKIINGAKNLIGKIVPAVKTGLSAVSKIAPVVAAGASALGGPIGATIGGVANTIGNVAGGISNLMNNGPPKLGANGAGIRVPVNGANRFALPMLQ